MAERGWHFVNGTVPHSYHVLGAGDLPTDPDYRRGLFSIQSESSMLAAMAVGARPGMNVIDAGVAVLSMHAPYEVISKADLFEAYKGYLAFLQA